MGEVNRTAEKSGGSRGSESGCGENRLGFSEAKKRKGSFASKAEAVRSHVFGLSKRPNRGMRNEGRRRDWNRGKRVTRRRQSHGPALGDTLTREKEGASYPPVMR